MLLGGAGGEAVAWAVEIGVVGDGGQSLWYRGERGTKTEEMARWEGWVELGGGDLHGDVVPGVVVAHKVVVVKMRVDAEKRLHDGESEFLQKTPCRSPPQSQQSLVWIRWLGKLKAR